jgi:hypothetical protein
LTTNRGYLRNVIGCGGGYLRRTFQIFVGVGVMAQEDNDTLNNAPIPGGGGMLQPATTQSTAQIRSRFAKVHIESARRYCGLVAAVEQQNHGQGWGSHWTEARDYASAAIIMSFAAVEAAINEALDDLEIEGELHDVIEKASTIDSAQALLIHASASPMDRGTNPLQSLNLLRVIRNGLIHARGEWMAPGSNTAKISQKIVSAGLPLSPFDNRPEYAFERGIMSAGSANWAADTACDFIDELRMRAQLEPLSLMRNNP